MRFQAFSSSLDLLLSWLKPHHCRQGVHMCMFTQPIVLLITAVAQRAGAECCSILKLKNHRRWMDFSFPSSMPTVPMPWVKFHMQVCLPMLGHCFQGRRRAPGSRQDPKGSFSDTKYKAQFKDQITALSKDS